MTIVTFCSPRIVNEVITFLLRDKTSIKNPLIQSIAGAVRLPHSFQLFASPHSVVWAGTHIDCSTVYTVLYCTLVQHTLHSQLHDFCVRVCCIRWCYRSWSFL